MCVQDQESDASGSVRGQTVLAQVLECVQGQTDLTLVQGSERDVWVTLFLQSLSARCLSCLLYVQAIDGECSCLSTRTNVYGRDERGLSSARALQLLGPMSELTKGCQWGCSMISCDSGTKSSLGPDSYFTSGLIYKGNPALGYMLLVPPMPLTVALAN